MTLWPPRLMERGERMTALHPTETLPTGVANGRCGDITRRCSRERSTSLSLPNIPKNRAQFPRRAPFFHPTPRQGEVFPVPVLCLGAEFAPRQLRENAFSLALAAHLDGVFCADHHHIVASGGASGEAVGIVAAVRQILKRRVEGKAIEGLQFFDRRETSPSDW